MSESPIRSLVGQMLSPIDRPPGFIDTSELYLTLFDAAAVVGAEAIAGSGVGLDHFAGERVLASVLLRDTPKGNEHRLAMTITDRRTALSGWSSIQGPMTFNAKRGSVLHAQLSGVDVKEGILKHHVALLSPEGRLELAFGEAVSPLGALYRALGAIAPEQRVEPPTPFVTPSDADPTGAAAAAGALWAEDAEARWVLQQIASAAARAQMDPATGQDFVGRVVLAHRTRMGGPGMREGRWVSPMSSQDLGNTLVRIFGHPAQHQRPQPGVELLDFQIDPRHDYLGAAMTALGVASNLAIGFGISPGKAIAKALMKKREVTSLRVMFADLPGCSGYKLFGNGSPLHHADSRMAQRVHQALAMSAYSVLARRASLGWGASYEALWAPAA